MQIKAQEVMDEESSLKTTDISNLTLSPIIEGDEFDLFGNVLSGEQYEEEPETCEISADMNRLQSVTVMTETKEEVPNQRSCTEVPVTPPDLLRKRLNNLQNQYDYLTKEHEELVEFTKLEKQINHVGCIPKEQVRSLEDDLTSLNGKVQYLIDENSGLKTKMEQKDEIIKNLEKNITKSLDDQEDTQQTIMHVGRKIRTIVKEDLEIINNINSDLQRAGDFRNCEMALLSEDYDVSLQNGLEYFSNLFQVFENNRSQLKLKFQDLYSDNIELRQNTKEINNKFTELQSTFSIYEKEKVHLEKLLKVADISVNKLSEEISNLKNKLKDTEYLKETINLENVILQKEIENYKNTITINDIQQVFGSVINEFEQLIDSWDNSFKFKDVFISFDDNKTLLTLLDTLLNPATKSKLVQVLDKLKDKLFFYDEENNQLQSAFEKLKYRIESFESETKELKSNVRKLNDQIKEELNNKINQLESIAKDFCENEKYFQHNYLGNKSDIIPEAIHTYSCKHKDTEYLVAITDDDKSKLEQKENENINRFVKLDIVHEEIKLILKAFERIVDAWDVSNNLYEVLAQLKENNKITSINVLVDVNLQKNFFQVLDKFRCKLSLFEEGKGKLLTNIEELSSYVQQLENEQYISSDVTRNSECDRSYIACVVNKPNKEHVTIDSSEELQILKEMMILELTSLDCGEDKEILMNCSSAEIFSKLMQNIIQKEGEVSLDLEKQFKYELENSQERLENMGNKLKHQESWLATLENENDKMSKELASIKKDKLDCEIKLKSVSSDYKYAFAEISILKSKILELTTENDMLRIDLNTFKDSTKSTKDLIQTFQNKIFKLTEELGIDKKVIADLKSNMSSPEYCNNIKEKTFILSENNIRDKCSLNHKNYLNLEVNSCSCSGHCREKLFDCNKIEDINYENTQLLLCGMEKEKTLLKDLLKNNSNNTTLSEQLFTFANSIVILKEVINVIANKVMDLETSNQATIHDFQNIIDSTSKDLNQLKLNIIELFREVQIDTSSILTSDDIEVMSLKRELEFVKGECKEMCDKSREFESSAKMGQSLTKKLRDLLKVIQHETNNKMLIEELNKTICFKEQTITEQNVKLEKVSSKINTLNVKSRNLKVLVKDLQSQVSNLKSVLSKLETGFPLDMENIDATIAYINEKCKQHEENRLYVIQAEEEVRFFSLQCFFMISYINKLEFNVSVIQKQQDILENEFNTLKTQSVYTNKHLTEANIFVSKVISMLPFKVSSLHEAMEIMCKIFSEFTSLKEAQVNLMHEIKLKEEKIFLCCEEIQSQNKINSNLKLELSGYEDSIRNLRSELRNFRLHNHRRKENGYDKSNILVKEDKITRETQTSDCCCNKLELQILKYKQALEDRGSQITSLQLQVQEENYPYKRKVFELEEALAQAKERFKTLKLETIVQKKQNNF